MDLDFPMPFCGIDRMIGPLSDELMATALAHLQAGCGKGHAHNFAVQMDGMRLWTSTLGAHCVMEVL